MIINTHNLKKKIHHQLSYFFPARFKRKSFGGLGAALKDRRLVDHFPEIDLLALNYCLDDTSTVIDIGANNGLYCYFFKDLKTCRRVIAFEPLPHLYKRLVKWFPDVEVHPIAISDQEAEAPIRIPYINHRPYETRAKLDELHEGGETAHKEIRIHTDTLDHQLSLLKPERVDLIKIDIEGHEGKAIEGARQTIARYQPLLLIEIEKRHHARFATVFDQIAAMGYRCYFFHFAAGRLEDLSSYDAEQMQAPANQNTFSYINNFLFVPVNNEQLVARINTQLHAYFNASL